MRPFLFLGTRAEDGAADDEYAAVLRFTGLDERDVHRRRLELETLGEWYLDDWSGVVLGGGPFNISDPLAAKSPVQRRVESELHDLALAAVDADFPFFGACYGIGTLGTLQGGVVDRTYGEPIGAVSIRQTEAGVSDPLFGVMPERFDAFLGHKEAVTRMPTGGVLLAGGDACPVQAFRLGRNVYATQFHPELDRDGLCLRIDTYRHHGYFDPPQADELMRLARASVVTEPPRLLARFVELYAR
ncbi:MAG: glutamine amidotransferase [Nocardioides sp.]